MASIHQLEANRANAKRSTGPRTEQGKAKSRINGQRHNCTGQVDLMADEDRAAHKAFCDPLIADLAPVGAVELQLARLIATGHWRINRMQAREANLFALAHFTPLADLVMVNDNGKETDHPEVHTALTEARALSANMKELQLITLYIQRTSREITKNMAALEQHQKQRRYRHADELRTAERMQKLDQMLGQPFDAREHARVRALAATGNPSVSTTPGQIGFAFSSEHIAALDAFQTRDHEAWIAQRAGWDLKKYKEEGGALTPATPTPPVTVH